MSNKRIIVLQRGWVAIGDFWQSGSACKLENASIIRRWGTLKGLGELALEGPKAETILDPAGTLRFHELGIVTSFDVVSDKWN